ncbi:MFS transporter [Leptolyngbya sp. FACHB-261]|uniref:MFS transporter n=1 Tax=Leptolyngbya sp. FACHB-261 TaxID=2692806 RepID=UPI0016844262|nr:MFS transporter [Leptolyngbya sp. FACHB-261]MBD2101189.1 MFS transporter [Leptolyngbya sp. FACHB-261]
MTRLSDSALDHLEALRATAEPPSEFSWPRHGGARPLNEQALEVLDEEEPGAEAEAELQASPSQEPEVSATGFTPVLKNRDFLALWSGQVFSQLADKVYLVLMIALVSTRFQTAGQTISGWVSSVMISFTIPAILFGSIAGVFVDRWPKKPVLVASNVLRGVLVLAVPPLLWLCKDWSPLWGLPMGFWGLLAITFFVSTLTQFFSPAEQAVIPLIVERRHLLSANSLYTTTMMASVIIGFAVGEPVLALADALFGGWGAGKEIVVGGSYILAGLLLLLMQVREGRARRPAVTPEQALIEQAAGYAPEHIPGDESANSENSDSQSSTPHIWADIREGLSYLRAQSGVRAALIQLVILFSIFAALAVISVRMAEVMPNIKSSQFGFLLAAGGVGMAIGAALVGQFGQRFTRRQLSLYGSLGMATALGGLALMTQRLWPALGLIAMLGLCAAIVGVPMQTLIQEETPEAMRGKVFGLQNNAINIALSLPLALAGVAETFFGLRLVILGLGAIVVTSGILTWYISGTGTFVTD